MRIIPHEQRTEGWYAARRGVPTASSFGRLITPTGKQSASFDSYVDELVAEKITGESKFIPTTAAMQHGIDTEPKAREYYEFMCDRKVIEVGLCLHDTIEAGASPDGLVGDDGMLEIKCPQPGTMVKYLREDILPPEYKAQVMGQLWICEREWVDFMAYHEKMKPLLIRVERDEEYISALAEIVTTAVVCINESTEILTNKF
jgi:putative phage-type endonuclease